MKQFLRKEDGQLLVFFPYMILIIVALTTGVLNLGGIFLLKHQTQAAADASALAGASATIAPFARDEYDNIIPGVVDIQIDPDTADIEAMYILEQNIVINRLEEKGVTFVDKKGEAIDKKNYKVTLVVKIKPILDIPLIGGEEKEKTIIAISKVDE